MEWSEGLQRAGGHRGSVEPGAGDHRGAERNVGRITRALREQGGGGSPRRRGTRRGDHRREPQGDHRARGGGGPGAQRRPRGRVWAGRPFRPRGRPAPRCPLASPRTAPPLIGPARPPSPFPNMEALTGLYQARHGAGGAARRLAAATRLRAAGGPGRWAGASRCPPFLPPQWEVPRIPEEVISHFRLAGPELRCHHGRAGGAP